MLLFGIIFVTHEIAATHVPHNRRLGGRDVVVVVVVVVVTAVILFFIYFRLCADDRIITISIAQLLLDLFWISVFLCLQILNEFFHLIQF